MYLENVVVDAADPQRLGRFWERALEAEALTDEPGIYETRVALDGGRHLDLCFQQVADADPAAQRVQLAVLGGEEPSATVERLLTLGAHQPDDDTTHGNGVAVTDPDGYRTRVLAERQPYEGTGPIAALRLESSDVARDAVLWAWLTGWEEIAADAPRTLRHPSGTGPLLELWPQRGTKPDAKSPLHLDVRLEADDDPDDVAAGIAERGGRELHLGWGDLPWRHFADASGNELCVLPASPS